MIRKIKFILENFSQKINDDKKKFVLPISLIKSLKFLIVNKIIYNIYIYYICCLLERKSITKLNFIILNNFWNKFKFSQSFNKYDFKSNQINIFGND